MILENEKLIASLKDGLIVSCQVKKDDPFYMEGIIGAMAKAAAWGGAAAIRANSPQQIREVKESCDLPVIGLWKIDSPNSDVFITPSMEAVDAIIEAGSDIVAVDTTDRLNADGEKAYTIIKKIQNKYPDKLIFADIRNADEAEKAAALGAHFVAPTLYRFGSNPKSTDNPDFEEFAEIVRRCEGKAYPIMEGKIKTPEEAMQSLYLGAHAVVVGSAITRPHITTLGFTVKMNKYKDKMPLRY